MTANDLTFHALDGITKAAQWIDDHFTTAELMRLSFAAFAVRFACLFA